MIWVVSFLLSYLNFFLPQAENMDGDFLGDSDEIRVPLDVGIEIRSANWVYKSSGIGLIPILDV